MFIGVFVEFSADYIECVDNRWALSLSDVHCKLYILTILYKVDGMLAGFHRYGTT